MSSSEKIYKISKEEWYDSKEIQYGNVEKLRIKYFSILYSPQIYEREKRIKVPESIPDIVKYLKVDSSLIYAQDLARRLEAIIESFKNGEEFEEQAEIEVSSLNRAILFLEKLKFTSLPSLIITFEGFVKLVWESKNTLLEITPISNKRTSISLSSTNHQLKKISKKVIADDAHILSELDVAKRFLFEII